jgi:archaemetzincin
VTVHLTAMHATDPEHVIGILPLGDVPAIVPKVVAAHVSAIFNLAALPLASRPTPRLARDPERLQYDAGKILEDLEAGAFEGCGKIIAVVSVDLFVPVFTYVLGEARQGGRCALLSLFRLASTGGDRQGPLFLERCAKVALHELGHLFNLTHCNDNRCLMSFAGSAEELDEKRMHLCRYCTLFLREAKDYFPSV